MNKPGRPLQALTGLLMDMFSVMKGNPFVPHSLLKRNILNMVRKKTKADALIEVGTYLGVTAKRCSKTFEKVYTIELDQDLYQKARRNLKNCPNIEVFQGDGRDRIKEILSRGNKSRCVIFLDGHYSGGNTASAEIPEPALDELEIIKNFKSQVAGIVIDDFRNFGEEKGLPTKHDLLRACQEWFPEYHLVVEFDQVILFKEQ